MKNIFFGTIREMKRSHILLHAPKLAFFFLLSLFPLLICLVLVLGLFLESSNEARSIIQNYLNTFAPSSASDLINRTLYDVIEGSSSLKVSFAVVFTLWAASRGMTALIEGMNSAYATSEVRPWWKRNLISLGLTLSILILLTSLILVSLYTSPIAENVFAPLGIGARNIQIVIEWLEWPSMILLAAITLGIIYKFGPARKQKDVLSAIIPGLLLWILASMIFKLYLSFFDRINVTYGFLSSVIILMIWLYLTGLSVLLGSIFNVVWTRRKEVTDAY